MTKSKTEKLINALSTGRHITAEQIENRFGLANPSATIHRIRETYTDLPTIYTNPKRDSDGYRYYTYRMAV